jgi:hypothetical protein
VPVGVGLASTPSNWWCRIYFGIRSLFTASDTGPVHTCQRAGAKPFSHYLSGCRRMADKDAMLREIGPQILIENEGSVPHLGDSDIAARDQDIQAAPGNTDPPSGIGYRVGKRGNLGHGWLQLVWPQLAQQLTL